MNGRTPTSHVLHNILSDWKKNISSTQDVDVVKDLLGKGLKIIHREGKAPDKFLMVLRKFDSRGNVHICCQFTSSCLVWIKQRFIAHLLQNTSKNSLNFCLRML